MKKSGWKIILGVAVLVCVICLGRFGWVKYQDYKTEQARKATLKEIASTEFTGENEGKEPEKVPAGVKHGQKINFKKLIKINSDIYAWIYVPGTRIDYPVAQSQESDDHYLKYNFKNEPEFAGCIYTEKANKKDFSDPNTVFYGHNMRNGSMFQNLHKFEDEAFFKKHKEVYVYTPKKTYTYTIFAAYKFDDRHLLKTFNFKNKKKFENYLRNVKNIRDMGSHVRKDQEVTSNDKIITLSTCVGGQPNNRYLVQAVIIVLAVIILLPCAAIVGMWALGKGSLFGGKMKMSKNVDGVKVQNQGDLVIYNGHKYQYNKDITSILFMGVDRDKINTDEEYLKKHGAGQSDTLFLAAVNTSTGKISLINVPRDIMAYVKTYDENGKYSGRKLRQLCLAYAYGDGKAKSCKNAVDAVSKVLYGIPIDSYMSINLSAISVLNDAVGGVNVQVIGDLTSVDPTLKEGANVTLLGGQAETYVRSREFDPLDANMARMQRQQQYITAFAQKALQEMKGDLTLPLDLLNLVSENSVTNLSAPKITYLATKVSGSSFSSDNIYSIDCDIKEGETGYAEYYPDETKLFEMILKVFYTQIS